MGWCHSGRGRQPGTNLSHNRQLVGVLFVGYSVRKIYGHKSLATNLTGGEPSGCLTRTLASHLSRKLVRAL